MDNKNSGSLIMIRLKGLSSTMKSLRGFRGGYDIYPNAFEMQVSVGVKNGLGKAFIVGNGYSITKINNAA